MILEEYAEKLKNSWQNKNTLYRSIDSDRETKIDLEARDEK